MHEYLLLLANHPTITILLVGFVIGMWRMSPRFKRYRRKWRGRARRFVVLLLDFVRDELTHGKPVRKAV